MKRRPQPIIQHTRYKAVFSSYHPYFTINSMEYAGQCPIVLHDEKTIPIIIQAKTNKTIFFIISIPYNIELTDVERSKEKIVTI